MKLQLPITATVTQLLKPSSYLGIVLFWTFMGLGMVPICNATSIQPRTPLPELYLVANTTFYMQPDAVVSEVHFTKHTAEEWTNILVQNQKEGILYIATGTIFTIKTIPPQPFSRTEPQQVLAQSHQKKSNRTAPKTTKDKTTAATAIILPLHPYQKTASSQELHKIAPPTVTGETIKTTNKNKITAHSTSAALRFDLKAPEVEKQQKKVQYLILPPFVKHNFSLPPPSELLYA